MGGNSFFLTLLKQTGIYKRSLGFFLIVGGLLFGGYYLERAGLQADEPPQNQAGLYDLEVDLSASGQMYAGKTKLDAEVIAEDKVYRYRYQLLNRPKNFIDSLTVAVYLPRPATAETVSHRLVNNGGASIAESELINNRTVVYRAKQITPQAQLVIELEIPRSFVRQSATLKLREKISQLPLGVWTGVSIALPILTGLILLLLSAARTRRITLPRSDQSAPPSSLPPAVLGILLRGRLTNRELASTLIDLARRGHLVIRQLSGQDFRFSCRKTKDRLEDFEKELLSQLFGPLGGQISSEEIEVSLNSELFSHQVSRAFVLAYKRIHQLGYFYLNPLILHRRYQVAGIVLFVIALSGFFINLTVINGFRYLLIFWIGMILASLMITRSARSLPVRSAKGDRELGVWLKFGEYLSDPEPMNYQAQSQEGYLAYLPYAIVLGLEAEWTNRFYHLPFAKPSWYISSTATTVDEFANQIFPLFGYLSHLLVLSSQPAAR